MFLGQPPVTHTHSKSGPHGHFFFAKPACGLGMRPTIYDLISGPSHSQSQLLAGPIPTWGCGRIVRLCTPQVRNSRSGPSKSLPRKSKNEHSTGRIRSIGPMGHYTNNGPHPTEWVRQIPYTSITDITSHRCQALVLARA